MLKTRTIDPLSQQALCIFLGLPCLLTFCQLYSDRTSHYDEKTAHLITDYATLVTQMKDLVNNAIYQVNDQNKKQELVGKLKAIFSTKTISKDSRDEERKYEDLTRGEFNLNVVMRIERTNYKNSTRNYK